MKIQFVEIRCYLSWNRYPVSNNFCDVLKIYKNIQHTFWTFCYCRKEVTSNKNITSSDLFSSMQLFYCSFLYEGCQLICWIMHFELILIVKVIGIAFKKNTLPLSLTAINKLSRVNILHLFTMLKLSDRFHISINWWINNEILNFFQSIVLNFTCMFFSH